MSIPGTVISRYGSRELDGKQRWNSIPDTLKQDSGIPTGIIISYAVMLPPKVVLIEGLGTPVEGQVLCVLTTVPL